MPRKKTQNLSFDLVNEQQLHVALAILDNKFITYASTNEPAEVQLPEGCVGILMVFDTPEAAHKHFKREIETIAITRNS